MAATTKYTLMEQVRQLVSGNPAAADKFEQRSVLMYLQQAVNKKLRTEYFATTLPSGDTIPEGYVLASYDNVPVVAYKDRSRSQLPAMPVRLIRGLGVFHISLTNDLDNPFIPLQSGQNALVKKQSLINSLLGQVGYEVADGYAIYTEDLTARAVPITSVFMRLVVMDFDKYSDYDLLPLTAEMASDIVLEVYQLLSGVREQNKVVDSSSKP